MGATVTKTEFSLVGTDEPHASRRKEILAKYPHIRQLYGPDIRLALWVSILISIQLFFAIASVNFTILEYLISAYIVGGTITHALSLANHELAHNLGFREPLYNELLAMLANFAQGLPSCITFKKYHLEHHYYQGVDTIDTDVPTAFEGKIFNTTPRKLVWAFLQPAFYAVRPMMVNPKPLSSMELLNLFLTVAFDLWLARAFGWAALGYNISSTLLGMGLHPCAGHFIAEHYEFTKGQETYSYYGPLNWLCFNVGYHNEHHDFPKVAGVNLPKVKKIAGEYYMNLNEHESWIKVIFDYIWRQDIGPFSRVKRVTTKDVPVEDGQGADGVKSKEE